MRLSKRRFLSAVIGALLGAAPIAATVKTGSEAQKSNALSAKAAQSAWKPETLTGKIMTVDASRRLVVVESLDNVLYDMRVTPETRILSGRQPVKLANLSSDINESVTVRFTPERSGDFAGLIQIQK
jgi:hypothetical protein